MIPSKIKEKFKELLSKTPEEWDDIVDEDMFVDKYALDEEVATVAQIYYKWAKLSKQARTFKKKMEARYNKIKNATELKVRRSPKKHGLTPDSKDKVMEGAVKATINNHVDVTKAYNDFLLAYKYRLTFIDAVNSANHKVRMIGEEIKLWRDEYYIDARLDKPTEEFRSSSARKRRKKRL